MRERLFSLLGDDEAVLVFPTQRSVRAFLIDYAYSTKSSLAAERAMSYDSFAALFEEDVHGRKKADVLVRTIFADGFMKKEGGRLSYLYNPSHKESLERFSSFIVSILPSLSETSGRFTSKALYHDIMLLKESYSAFLDQYGFYEANWIKRSLDNFKGDRTKKYYLAGAAAEPNMLSLMDELGDADFIIPINPEAEIDAPFHLYDNERAELSALFQRVEGLLDDGVPLQDIILATPDVERLRPYLEGEAAKRAIPLSFENDRPILKTKVGRYLNAINELDRSSYAYPALEALLLDTSLPYRPEILEANRALLIAMCEGNILDDSAHDLAYRLPRGEIRDHFTELQKRVKALTHAGEGAKLFASLQGLSTWLFGPEQFRNDESDMEVYSFILDRYGEMEELLEAMNEERTSLFRLFLGSLSSLPYVSQRRSVGIQVFQYGHDHMLHSPYRFVFALGDANSRREVGSWSFLDEWEVEGRRLVDVTEPLIASYMESADNIVFSGSRTTYSGQSMAPFTFSRLGLVTEESAVDKTRWTESEIRSALVHRRFAPLQDGENLTRGFRVYPDAWDGSLSYSSISSYMECPFKASIRVLFGLRDMNFNPQGFDRLRLGNILHSVLEGFLTEYKDRPLESASLDEYRSWIAERFDRELGSAAYTPYQESYIRQNYREGLLAFPEEIIKAFGDGLVVPRAVEVTVEHEGLDGRIDALLGTMEGYLVIDFKSGSAPKDQKYQLLTYKKILDGNEGRQAVDPGYLIYYSIRLPKSAKADGHVVHEVEVDKDGKYKQEEYDKLYFEMEKAIASTKDGYMDGVWKTTDDYKNCQNCSFRSLCRRRYYIQ